MLFPPSSADSGSGSFSPAIVNYVLHTGDDLLLDAADTDTRFSQCSYVANRRPKSVLCSGIRHQGELLGVIYLEHTQIAGAFNGQKLEWLRLLATEVGLTVWSARLSRYRDYVHKFAPAAVAKEIDANPASPNLAAKDSDVSILFGDLAGYTRMAEQMERRQLDELINRIFSRFIDEIHHYEGTLLEIRGDELFVLFGGPGSRTARVEGRQRGACHLACGERPQGGAVGGASADHPQHGHPFGRRLGRHEVRRSGPRVRAGATAPAARS